MLQFIPVKCAEPKMGPSTHIEHQANMVFFLTIFIFTCVEVFIVKLSYGDAIFSHLFVPHDPFYSSYEFDDDDDYEGDDDENDRDYDGLW